ncbi:hypothetical protein GCM10027289_10850 [Tsukamurella serpentis]
MADDRKRFPGNTPGNDGVPYDPEQTAAHRLGPPIRPMRPGEPRDFRSADTGHMGRPGEDSAPVDVAAVRRDDHLIEALAAGGAVNTADNAEFELASLLADWRDEIVSSPVPAGPSVDEVVAAQAAAASGAVPGLDGARSRKQRRFGLIAGGAAAALALLGGGALVSSADPGDGALWSVKEVVFSDSASQTLASAEANSQIQAADEQISAKNQSAAKSALTKAREQAAKVKSEKERKALEEKIRAAEARAGLPVEPAPGESSVSQIPSTAPVSTTTTSIPAVDLQKAPVKPTGTTTTPTTTTTTPSRTTTTTPSTTPSRTTTTPPPSATSTTPPVTTTTTTPPSSVTR